MSIRGKACIAGVYEHPTRFAPDHSIARIHAGESVSSLFDGVDPAHAPPQPKLPL